MGLSPNERLRAIEWVNSEEGAGPDRPREERRDVAFLRDNGVIGKTLAQRLNVNFLGLVSADVNTSSILPERSCFAVASNTWRSLRMTVIARRTSSLRIMPTARPFNSACIVNVHFRYKWFAKSRRK